METTIESRENRSPSPNPKVIVGKNGVAFEVMENEAKCPKPQRRTPHTTPIRNLTNDEIRAKSQKAEERRKSLQHKKLAPIAEKNQRLEEAAKFREESNQKFSKQAEQKLNSKMETNKENKEVILNSLMEKKKKKDSKKAQIRELNEKKTKQFELDISKKMVSAEENRQEKINGMIDRLKDHESHAEVVRTMQEFDYSYKFHEQEIEKMKEKIREHEKHAEEIRERAKSPNQSDYSNNGSNE